MDEHAHDSSEADAFPGKRQASERLAPTVRAARDEDLAALVAFNAAMAQETEGKRLDVARLQRGVSAALADAVRGRYLVAELDGRVVGALLLTREWSDWRAGWFWWIQSVYVTPAARGRGIYGELHREVERQAHADPDVCGVRLYVEHDNGYAQAVYSALGMRRTGYRFFERDFTAEPRSSAGR